MMAAVGSEFLDSRNLPMLAQGTLCEQGTPVPLSENVFEMSL